MTQIAITKTRDFALTAEQKAVLHQYLLGVIDGASAADKKAWRRFWTKVGKLEPGELFLCDLIFPRNSKYHRKFFALLNFAYEAWEPDRLRKMYRGMPVTKNFERFRKDVVIQAGFYEQTFNLDGDFKLEAKSISFASMDDEQFAEVYDAVADVILSKVLVSYKDRAELDEVVGKVMRFL